MIFSSRSDVIPKLRKCMSDSNATFTEGMSAGNAAICTIAVRFTGTDRALLIPTNIRTVAAKMSVSVADKAKLRRFLGVI